MHKKIMKRMKKRGLSPVIATALLIVIVLVLALIIFLWARGFLAERTIKFGEPVERACDDVSFEAEVISVDKLNVVNRGNVPLYGIDIYKLDNGRELIESVRCVSGEETLRSGENCEMQTSASVLNSGINILVVPVILGEKGNTDEPFSCPTGLGQEIEIP